MYTYWSGVEEGLFACSKYDKAGCLKKLIARTGL